MMLHIKFDQDWPTGFRDIQVQKCEIFVTQEQVTLKWVVWFGPPIFQLEVNGKFFRRSRAANSVVSSKFELVRDFMHVRVTCKYKKDRIKSNREKVETPFSPLLVNGGFLLPWTLEFWSNLPQNLMQPFPHSNDATHTIWSRLANWLQRYSSSKVWNFRHSRASNSKMSGLIRPKSLYACPSYQQLWWWFDQKRTS